MDTYLNIFLMIKLNKLYTILWKDMDDEMEREYKILEDWVKTFFF